MNKRSAKLPGIAACILGAAVLSGCIQSLDVPQSTIDACVRSSGFPDGTEVRVEQQLRTDNLRSRVLPSRDISQEKSYEINDCIEASVKGSQQLPSVAGVPQSVTSSQTGTIRTDTYTYGTPPATPTSVVPLARCERGGGVFQGGTGYCAR